jgi:hypothetical protein
MDIEKLEKWVKENPEAADAPTINITTGKEFTIRDVLKELKKEKVSGIVSIDKEVIEIKKQIEEWLEKV